MNKKPNVLFISSWYPNRVTPTNGDFIQRHANAASLFCNVIFLHVVFDPSLQNSRTEKKELLNEYYKEIIIYFGIKQNVINSIFRNIIKWRLYIELYLNEFKRIKKQYGKPDIIHSNIIWPNSIIALLLLIKYKISYVISEHYTFYLKNTKIKFFQRFCSKLIAKNASYILPVTKNLQTALQKHKLISNYKVVPNVVDTEIFFPNYTIKHKIVPIIHISTLLDRHKNISGILNTIKKLSNQRNDFVLNIVGPTNEDIIKKAKKLNIFNTYVKFLGEKKHEEIPELIRESAFLLLFSNYENLPCVIVEALATGIPVISSEVGGIHEYINDNNGILVEPKNEKKLFDAINYMIDNYKKYNKKEIREFAEEKFSNHSIGKQFFDIYNEILE